MCLVGIDVIGAQVAQRRFELDPRALRPAQQHALEETGVGMAELGGDHEVGASSSDRATDELLGQAVPVAFGGVDEIDASLPRARKQALGLFEGEGLATHHRTATPRSPRPIPEGWFCLIGDIFIGPNILSSLPQPRDWSCPSGSVLKIRGVHQEAGERAVLIVERRPVTSGVTPLKWSPSRGIETRWSSTTWSMATSGR